MKFVILAIVLCGASTAHAWWFFGSSSNTAYGSELENSCIEHGQSGDCEFFDCFERRLSCGREYYNQRYGDHYCQRFLASKSTFTPDGQAFLERSQQCLTNALVEYYMKEQIDCHDYTHDAMDIFGNCYKETGFCEVIGDNTQQFLEVFQMNDLFRRDSAKLWRELFKLARHCGGQAFTDFMRATVGRFSAISSYFTDRD